MKKNQNKIIVKRIKNNCEYTIVFTIKNNEVYDEFGNPVYCNCTGNTVETATPMKYNENEGVYCPNCHEKKVEILQTYEEWKQEKDEEERKRNEEKLANLHLVEAGSDWECGFIFYSLSAQIDYDDWLKVKEHFQYYQKGWSRGQELEWNYGEPTGWLTQNPKAVEEILVREGLIRQENTMEAIHKRAEIEKQKKTEEKQKQFEKRQELKKQMDAIDEKIKEAFNNDVRELSDAEAYKSFYNCTYGKGTICTYTITDSEIIQSHNMGDFKYGIAIQYSSEVEELIKEYYQLNDEFWKSVRG